jgi:hypothetical protein
MMGGGAPAQAAQPSIQSLLSSLSGASGQGNASVRTTTRR